MRQTLISLVLFLTACPEASWDTGGQDTGESDMVSVDGGVAGEVCGPAGTYVFVAVDWDEDGVEDGRFEAWTDEAGRFRLEGLMDGAYILSVARAGSVQERLVQVGDGAVRVGCAVERAPVEAMERSQRVDAVAIESMRRQLVAASRLAFAG